MLYAKLAVRDVLEDTDVQVAHWKNATYHIFFILICMFHGVGDCHSMCYILRLRSKKVWKP